MLVLPVERGVRVDPVDGFDVLSDQGEDLLLRFQVILFLFLDKPESISSEVTLKPKVNKSLSEPSLNPHLT